MDAISWIENNRQTGNVEIVLIDDDLITHSARFIRFNHLSADDALHAYCAGAADSDLLLMQDSRFAYWLKNPDVVGREEERMRPKYHYHVIDLNDRSDAELLESMC